MKDFYKKLHTTFEKQAVKSRYTDLGLTPIRTINLYAGQDFNPEDFEAPIFPAVFLAWDINYQTQLATAAISIRLAYEQLRDISNHGKQKEKGLKFLDMVRLTDDILKSIQTKTTGKLSLINEGLDLQPTVVDVYKLNYECSYNGASQYRRKETTKGQVDSLTLSDRLKASLK